jgi:hypothetical protein
MKKNRIGLYALGLLFLALVSTAFAATFSGTISVDNGSGAAVLMKPGDSVEWTYSVDSSEQFIGTLSLQKSTNGGATWDDIFSVTSTVISPLEEGSTAGTYVNENILFPKMVRFHVDNIDDANTSDELHWAIEEVNDVYKDAAIVKGVVKTDDGVELLKFYEDGVQIPQFSTTGTSSFNGGITKSGIVRYFNAGGRAGTTSGWSVSTGNIGVIGNLPASQTGSTFLIPLSGLEVGDQIVEFHMIGQIEAGGGTATLDADLRRLTAAASDVTDESVDTMTQVATSSDLALSSSNTSTTLDAVETVGELETFYIKVTGTTQLATDVALQGVALTITKTY